MIPDSYRDWCKAQAEAEYPLPNGDSPHRWMVHNKQRSHEAALLSMWPLVQAAMGLMDAINPINYPARKWSDPKNDIEVRGVGSRSMPDEEQTMNMYRAIKQLNIPNPPSTN
jgi:hypothetical protein